MAKPAGPCVSVDASRDPDVFRIAAEAAEPPPSHARERMHRTVRRAAAEPFEVAV